MIDRKMPKPTIDLRSYDNSSGAEREAGVDLPLEPGVSTEPAAAIKRKSWLDDNRAAIASYNELVDMYGVFSASARNF